MQSCESFSDDDLTSIMCYFGERSVLDLELLQESREQQKEKNINMDIDKELNFLKQMRQRLPIETEVRIKSNSEEFNEKVGSVKAYQRAKNRYIVEIKNRKKMVSVRAENVTPTESLA